MASGGDEEFELRHVLAPLKLVFRHVGIWASVFNIRGVLQKGERIIHEELFNKMFLLV